MEDKRARTLEALSTFIQAQKTLLARTQADIERLHKLKDDALSQQSSLFVSNLSHELSASAFKLSDQLDCATGPPDDIDWSLYTNHDPAPLHAFASTSRLTHAQRNEPQPIQRTPLSDLQKLVKSARLTLVDPVLSLYHCPSEPSSDEDDVPDPEELNREREREKIRALKGRRIISSCSEETSVVERKTVGANGRSRGPGGVFIRRDVQDESAEVDIDVSFSPEDDRKSETGKQTTIWSGPGYGNGETGGLTDVDIITADATEMAAATPLMSVSSSFLSTTRPPTSPSLPMALTKSTRIRRPTTKLQAPEPPPLNPSSLSNNVMPTIPTTAQRSGRRKTTPMITAKDEPSPPPTVPRPNAPATPQQTLGKRTRDTTKPRPETYKQAWTVEEQHLLEKLLDDIPDGEKNRWQKISLAMKGHRTPRQVASRVQKYFEKLKRFGVGVDIVNETDGGQ